jgi:hypothetical protein
LAKLEPDQIKKLWSLIEPLIIRANKHTFYEYDEEDMFTMLMNKSLDCWMAWEGDEVQAILTTRIFDYPNQKILEFYQMASNVSFEEVREHIETIAKWGKDQECTQMTAYGRKGWAKLLPDWNTKYIIMSRSL